MSQDNTNYGRDQNIFNDPQNINFYTQEKQPPDPVLKKLLVMVQREVEERLAQSLHRVVDAELLNLGKALEPHQVRSPWAMEMSVQESLPQLLPPEITIAQVFELPEVEQKLLILGEPGSGKTTTLLELAQTIVERAIKDVDTPIPVLVNLSSWKDPQQPIFDWLCEELKSKYGLREELGRKFLIQNRLLPFLDGLDEVATIRQEDCAVGLNTWLTGDIEQQPTGTVICCRIKEYEEIVKKRLFLDNSIALQPLTHDQIKNYLSQLKLNLMWESMQASPELQDLLQKPLFLGVFGLVSIQFKFSDWQQLETNSARTKYLFDQYWTWATSRALVDERTQEQGILSKTYNTNEVPGNNDVKRKLIYAAKIMQQEFQTELLIEGIQKNWLTEKYKEFQFCLIIFAQYVIVHSIFSIFFLGFNIGIVYGLMGGILFGFFACLGEDIRTFEFFRFSILLFARGFVSIGLFAVILFGFLVDPLFGIMSGIIFGLIGGLVIGIKADSTDPILPNQGIKNSFQNMLVVTLASFLLSALLKFLVKYPFSESFHSTKVPFTLEYIFLILVWFGFEESGGKALLQHIALRFVLALNGYVPYRYDKLLNYCTERLLLQRIGGRYRFMHKLLQEHFAKMPLD